MFDPYGISPQLQQPVAPGTMNPNLNPEDEAAKRQKMLMMAEALRNIQQPVAAPQGGNVTAAAGNPLGSAMGGASQMIGLGDTFKKFNG
jgi:hypothetical protein